MSQPRCETCRFYLSQPTDEGEYPNGFCRRFPPMFPNGAIPGSAEVNPFMGNFPQVMGDNWCGEYSPSVPIPTVDAPRPIMRPEAIEKKFTPR